METFFLPNAQQAKNLRSSMSSLLVESLKELIPLPSSLDKNKLIEALESPHYARPLDFAAYFDLLSVSTDQTFHTTTVQTNLAQQYAADSLSRLTHFSPAPSATPATPRISTLSSAFYHPDHIQSLIRWWDMEPNNSPQLTAVSENSLLSASNDIHLALTHLQLAAPEMYQEVITVVSDIVLAQPGKDSRMAFGGISSFCSWGSICLNQVRHAGWTDYYKKIVHECSHLVLFAIARNEPLVLNGPTDTCSSPLRMESRPIDGVFHAAFVSAREALALDACITFLEELDENSKDDSAKESLENHLHSSVLAFWDCCDQLTAHANLSELGERVLSESKQYMLESFEVIT
jgi:hypothetical protein